MRIHHTSIRREDSHTLLYTSVCENLSHVSNRRVSSAWFSTNALKLRIKSVTTCACHQDVPCSSVCFATSTRNISRTLKRDVHIYLSQSYSKCYRGISSSHRSITPSLVRVRERDFVLHSSAKPSSHTFEGRDLTAKPCRMLKLFFLPILLCPCIV